MPKQSSTSYLDKRGSHSKWKYNKVQAIEVLEIIKEEDKTILPEYFAKKPHKALEILKEWGIAAEVYLSVHGCGIMIRRIKGVE